ncbi:winged helix-turn-helix transcriptional regulator [Sphingomonas mesophila]|uniref:winged helix-turn-helix transcriptional regulator n=1 Tax=Sphingomonas mesophila TaxID=2303576 RepID=UPI000E584EF6|nr:helix-turn-helix domain-containing protein [Sphingomonas mesophila]
MPERSYGQFCPVAMAAEILATRWTIVLLRELLAGSTRFNELRRGVPRMSPALLSQRLKELEEAGVVERVPVAKEPGVSEYVLTAAGRELKPIVEAFGCWGQRWVSSKLSLQQPDVNLLMWDMRRGLKREPMPQRRCIMQFQFSGEPAATRNWWIVATPGEPAELCCVDPGHDVDLYIATDVRTMAAIWMGHDIVRDARDAGRLMLTGPDRLVAQFQSWLGLSPFATVERPLAA